MRHDNIFLERLVNALAVDAEGNSLNGSSPELINKLRTHLGYLVPASEPPPGDYNALVPENAPILPVQAFVDNIVQFVTNAGGVNMSVDVTHISFEMVQTWAEQQTQAGHVINFICSGTSLSVEDVDGILDAFVAVAAVNGVVDLSGGTNAAPTRERVGSVTVMDGGDLYVDGEALIFTGGGGSGAAGTVVVTDGAIAEITLTNNGMGYTSAPVVTVDTFEGAGAILTAVLNNGNQTTLEGSGWTVTVNA